MQPIIRNLLILSSLTLSSLLAEEPHVTHKESLFSPQSEAEFSQALTTAKQLKLPQQTILEAKFLFYVDQSDHSALAKLSKELLAFENSFNPAHSEIFTLADDWKAIVKYTQSLAALEAGDEKMFKTYITEAFWLSPRQAGAFAPHIEQLKLDRAMQALTLDFDSKLPTLSSNKPALVIDKDATATILYFWSPWNREFIENIDEFRTLSEVAKKHNIKLTAILAEVSDEIETDATKTIQENKLSDSATWLKESKAMTLSTQLRIQSIPTVIVVTSTGKVLFNGSFSSKKLWQKLEIITPNIKPK